MPRSEQCPRGAMGLNAGAKWLDRSQASKGTLARQGARKHRCFLWTSRPANIPGPGSALASRFLSRAQMSLLLKALTWLPQLPADPLSLCSLTLLLPLSPVCISMGTRASQVPPPPQPSPAPMPGMELVYFRRAAQRL